MYWKMALFIATTLSPYPTLTHSIICSPSKPSVSLPVRNQLLKPIFLPLPTKRTYNTRLLTRTVERDQYDTDTTDLLLEVQGVEQSIKVLKDAAKTRRVAAEEVLSALILIKKAKIDHSPFLNTLGGTESPGRTWMLIFTAQDQLKRGSYFPVTAIQRFDAAVLNRSPPRIIKLGQEGGYKVRDVDWTLTFLGIELQGERLGTHFPSSLDSISIEVEAKRIENGVYLGPLGCLTFEGRFSWKKRILSFIFECIRIKIGPFGPLQISVGKGEEREPSTKDPFFIWFYVDEEIAVAQGRGGGTAFWCRCHRVT